MGMAVEHNARTAEGVGQDAIRAGLGVAPLDGQHPLGVSQIPRLPATALLEPCQHQLGAHRAIA
jgi:hypothetical protein